MLRRVLMFPAFVVAGGWVGWLWAYGSTSEDPLAPSRLVTVMAVWEVGDEDLCRAFSYRDLLPHLDTLGLRFALTAADIERCRDDFASYDSRPGWPLKLRQNEADYPGYSFEIEGTDPLEVMVHRSSGDPGNWAQTRYRVASDGSISDLRTNSASAGQGLGLVLGAFVGMFVWFCSSLLRRGRRASSVQRASDI